MKVKIFPTITSLHSPAVHFAEAVVRQSFTRVHKTHEKLGLTKLRRMDAWIDNNP